MRVVEVAASWIGTPYHHRARVKKAGVDCAQLIAAVYREAGLIDEVPLEEYPNDWMLHRNDERFRETVERYARPVERTPMYGDIVLFRFGRTLAHGGIVIGWPTFVHAYLPHKRVTYTSMEQEQDLEKRWGGTWTLKGWQ